MSSSRLDGETTCTTVWRSAAGRGGSPSVPPQQRPEHKLRRHSFAFFITLHGDRKRRRGPRPCPCCCRTHYPSWGSETSRPPSTARRSARRSTHYPSWGSETRGLDKSPDKCDLITPHGDRKLSRPSRRMASCKFCSLPLMGIGNRASAHPLQHHQPILITPHGDRKHESADRRRSAWVIEASLPLMGIGNSAGWWVWRHLIVLITPHGDRKPVHAAIGGGMIRDLITPHGDRKLPCNSPLCRKLIFLPGVSLPLMGIGNSARSAAGTAASPRSAHYPSWGSETRFSFRGPWARSGTHYPSWGSETREWCRDVG